MSKNINRFIIFFFFIFLILVCKCKSEQNESLYNISGLNETENNSINSDISEENYYEEYVNPLETMNYSNVLYLTDLNYTEALNKTDISFVLFFSSWCYYCKKFMPVFIQTAEYCKKKNMNITFARVDANLYPQASAEYNVSEYPTIYLLLKGKKFQYKGKRSQKLLLKFLEKKINNDVFIIKDLNEIKKYINESSIVLLSTIKNKDSLIYKSFYDYAFNSFENDFLSCTSEQCHKKYGEDIILFKNFDEKENSFKKDYGELSSVKMDSIDEFMSIFGIETGAFLGPRQIDMLLQYEKKSALIYVRNSSFEKDIKYDNLFKELGKELRFQNIYVFVSDNGEREGTNIESAFSIVPEDIPCIIYYFQDNKNPNITVKLYSLRSLDMDKITKEEIKQFIIDVKNNKIRRDLYSQPAEKSVMVNGLRYVVGKTFDKYVTDEKRNVFLAIIDKEDRKEEEILFLNIMRNLTKIFENISFCYLYIGLNEPRDLYVRNDVFPIGFLYTNAMEEKNIIKFVPKNLSYINREEIEIFLNENTKNYKRDKKEENNITAEFEKSNNHNEETDL